MSGQPSQTPLEAGVLVFGGGLAGATAALKARREGASVILIRRSCGATALSSGAASIASDPRALPGDLFHSRQGPIESARWIAAIRPEHPYAAVGADLAELQPAVDFAVGELGPLLAPLAEHNRWIATPFGSVRECALCQQSATAGDLSRLGGRVVVVGLRGHIGFDADLVAAGVNRLEGLGAPRAEAITIDLFMREGSASLLPVDLARALEAPGAAESAAALLRRELPAGISAALFPPILGLELAQAGNSIADRIGRAAGLPVAETLSDLPSVPGMRLQAAIDGRLAAVGVRVVSGEVRGMADGPGTPVFIGEQGFIAPAWILATGRFVGGGLARHGALSESVLDLPVDVAARSEGYDVERAGRASRPSTSLTSRRGRDTQQLFSAGVAVDSLLRPVKQGGLPIHARLHAAGAVIGGTESAVDGTGLGVAILTGYLAGRAAALGV